MYIHLKYKILFILLTAITLGYNVINAQTESRKYDSNGIKVVYHTKDGMLDGSYTAYYKNGKRKEVGNFEFNNKIGEWSVWDSTGKLCYQRVYSDGYTYKRTIPIIPNGPAKLLGSPIYIPTRNEDSCYKWYYLFEKNIVWSKRTWSFILNSDNPIFGSNNRLFNQLYKLALNQSIKTYKFNNEDWDKSFNDTEDISKIIVDTINYRVIGFLVKEDWFYDIDYGMLDCRLLGFCPIMVSKHHMIPDTAKTKKWPPQYNIKFGNDTIGLCWFYYPQMRKYLAKEKTDKSNVPEYVKNLDDAFFWKYYSEKLIGNSGVRGVSKIKDEWALRIQMLNMEAQIWQGYEDYQ